jgi:hypothetical protein
MSWRWVQMMTTNEATLNLPETAKASKPQLGAAWYQAVGKMLETCDFTKVSATNPYTSGSLAVTCVSQKAAEAARQVERLNFAKAFAEDKGAEFDVEGLVSSILLLQNLATGPIPIPVASWDIESGASLFFHDEQFYGDLEISGKTIEYLLKWKGRQGEQEVYGSEEIEEGRIPSGLLVHLFSSFARSNADMP